MMILLVGLEVLCQIGDPLGENGDLHLRGASVTVMKFVYT